MGKKKMAGAEQQQSIVLQQLLYAPAVGTATAGMTCIAAADASSRCQQNHGAMSTITGLPSISRQQAASQCLNQPCDAALPTLPPYRSFSLHRSTSCCCSTVMFCPAAACCAATAVCSASLSASLALASSLALRAAACLCRTSSACSSRLCASDASTCQTAARHQQASHNRPGQHE
jgi:hypothetical protein